MNESNLIRELYPVLKPFDIKPIFIEKYGKVYRIYGDKGLFALKKISLNEGMDFIRHIQWLFQKGYYRTVPIYPTTDGRYAVLYNHHLYYLMPWLSNEVKEDRFKQHQQMFRELARLHTLSLHEIPVHEEEKTAHYEKVIHEWEREKQFLEGFIEQCEEKIYMSPFELLFTQYFIEVFQALQFAENQLKEWYETSKEQKKARMVLVHGKISTEHYIYDDRGYGYFLNFEKSRYASPLHDLLPFLERTLKGYPKQCNECVDWLYTYFQYFPLMEDELHLMLSYFAHPGKFIKLVEKYYRSKEINELKYVQKLQKQYWLIKNKEYIVMRILEIEREKKQQAEEEMNDPS